MKTGKSQKGGLPLYLLAGLFIIFLSSCDAYNFSGPQPADRENIYQFPDKMLGTWREDTFTSGIDFSVPLNSNGGDKYTDTRPQGNNEDQYCYTITKQYVSFTTVASERIVKGAWPKLVNGNQFIYPYQYPGYRNYMQTIKYDSLNRPVDTVDNYIIYNHKIFEKTEDRCLEKGYSWYEDKDTLVIRKIDTVYIDLGQNAFLRKLTDSLWVFNMKKGILGEEIDQGWWMVMLLQKTADDTIIEWEPASKAGNLDCMFYDRPSKSDYFYFDCTWTATELLRLKAEGYFEKTGTLKRVMQ